MANNNNVGSGNGGFYNYRRSPQPTLARSPSSGMLPNFSFTFTNAFSFSMEHSWNFASVFVYLVLNAYSSRASIKKSLSSLPSQGRATNCIHITLSHTTCEIIYTRFVEYSKICEAL